MAERNSAIEILKKKCTEENFNQLLAIKNPGLHEFIAKYARHCDPDSVHVCTDDISDELYIRKKAIEQKEETALRTKGHTIHFDGQADQARDKNNTRYLVNKGSPLESLNSIEKKSGTEEVLGFLEGSMKGKEMMVCFFSLGPAGSEFTIPAVQVTDSYYVAHSEYILYRKGYQEFIRQNPKQFFKIVHSAGALQGNVSRDVASRRVYIDMDDYKVYSVNTQYAGNTVGFKKLALRLAIHKSSEEGWLAEHMLVMGVHGPGGRVSYFTGAFPSMCGKTATAMVKGETIIGDDLAYLRIVDGIVRAVNVEKGIFGIIKDVNEQDDPLIWKALTEEGDVIFSNVLLDDKGSPRWEGDRRPAPVKGINYEGEWTPDKKDGKGKPVSISHKNARYTLGLGSLENCDPALDDPTGVEVKGIIYGGRDSDTSVPVCESYNWEKGVIMIGASLESETTAATLGKEGVRAFNPMSNLDFLSIPLGEYIKHHLAFGKRTASPPSIFSVNYFLKDGNGRYMNAVEDKRVWLKWMELRVNRQADAIESPVGYIPRYEDLKALFRSVLDKDYSRGDYVKQFSIRIPKFISKIERMEKIFSTDFPDIPEVVFTTLREQKERLIRLRDVHSDTVSPEDLL